MFNFFRVICCLAIIASHGRTYAVNNEEVEQPNSIADAPNSIQVKDNAAGANEIAANITVEKLADSNNNDTDSETEYLKQLENCEKFCPRYYRPICANINGKLTTVSTTCEFNNKLRCARIARKLGLDAPTHKYLHIGPCLNEQ